MNSDSNAQIRGQFSKEIFLIIIFKLNFQQSWEHSFTYYSEFLGLLFFLNKLPFQSPSVISSTNIDHQIDSNVIFIKIVFQAFLQIKYSLKHFVVYHRSISFALRLTSNSFLHSMFVWNPRLFFTSLLSTVSASSSPEVASPEMTSLTRLLPDVDVGVTSKSR